LGYKDVDFYCSFCKDSDKLGAKPNLFEFCTGKVANTKKGAVSGSFFYMATVTVRE
jgi:hypothetical protein